MRIGNVRWFCEQPETEVLVGRETSWIGRRQQKREYLNGQRGQDCAEEHA